MHKVDAPGATVDGEFQDGDPQQGVEATLLASKWHNTIQREVVNVVENAGLVLDDQDDTQLLQAIERLRGTTWNEIINGDFSVWQRNGTPTAVTSTGYALDRWVVSAINLPGSQTINVSRQVVDSGDAALPSVSQYARFEPVQQTSLVQIITRLEDVTRYQSRTVTLSFWVRCASLSPLGIKIVQTFGPGGSAEVEVLNETGIASSAAWTRITRTIALPSIAGKTIDDLSHLRVEISADGSAGTPLSQLDLAAAQIQNGEYAGDFVARPNALERLLCARYFQSSRDNNGGPGTGAAAVAGDSGPEFWNLSRELFPMFRTPVVVWQNPTDLSLNTILVDGVEYLVNDELGRSPVSTGYPVANTSPTTYAKAEGHWLATCDFGDIAGDL